LPFQEKAAMKNRTPIIIAVIIGLLAIFSVHSYVKRVEQTTQNKLKGTPVVAARVNIAAGVELSMEMFTPKEVPEQFIPAQAIKGSAELKQILGRKLRVAVKAGQIVLWSDLVSEAKSGLSSAIPAGEGAFTVSIAKGIKSGLIQPNDHIDIIGSIAVPKPVQSIPNTSASWRQGSDMVNVVLLQNVTVLALGDSFGIESRATGGSGGGDVTVSLTLQESQLLMFASAHGELGAVLRRDGALDVKVRADLPRITFDAIDTIVGDLDGKRAMRIIEVQKGSKSESVPVSNSGKTQGDK
jgi:Flp pilus assembly protein CpaB